MSHFLLINELRPVDTIFFIVCAVLVLVAVGIYYLIPIINKKQYQEQRENLKKREEAFKSNLREKETKNSEEIVESAAGTQPGDTPR